MQQVKTNFPLSVLCLECSHLAVLPSRSHTSDEVHTLSLVSECHYRCHNNPHQSELLKASCWSVVLRLHARAPAVCCSYLLKCLLQGAPKVGHG
jgi:hypothetical protein